MVKFLYYPSRRKLNCDWCFIDNYKINKGINDIVGIEQNSVFQDFIKKEYLVLLESTETTKGETSETVVENKTTTPKRSTRKRKSKVKIEENVIADLNSAK